MDSVDVVVTGVPGGQTINHCGIKVLPGVLVRMSEADANAYGQNVRIVERQVQQLEVPKPKRPEAKDPVPPVVFKGGKGRIEEKSQNNLEE